MQHPAVKTERLDPALLPPSYHLQQQQKQQAQQVHQKAMAPQVNVPPDLQNVQGKTADGEKDFESQPDFPSIKGMFGWTVLDNVNIPYILRNDKQFVSVRIVEMKLLSRYPNSYPDDLGKHAPLTSFFVTPNEAKLLNEINYKHCECEYGKKEFTTKELIVLLTDFIKFYELVKKTFPDAASVRSAQIAAEGAGWLQIKNTVTPYIRRHDGGKYVPLSVIQYAAGLLTNENVNGVKPTAVECQMLNEACKKAGVEFVFSDSTTRLINLSHMLKAVQVEIIELPSSNPLKHATYMELPTCGGIPPNEKTKVKEPQQLNKYQSQPYRFQPNAIDPVRPRNEVPTHQNPSSIRGQYPPGHNMFDPRSMPDPRLLDMYRMQMLTQQTRGTLSNGPPNININHSNNPNQTMANNIPPMMQYFMNMQRHSLPDASRSNSSLQGHPLINGIDSSRSPGSSSNPSPRSRPPSQTRPPSGPSGSRPPSGSPLSPGSQPSPLGHPPPYATAVESNRMNGHSALHQLQNLNRLVNGSNGVIRSSASSVNDSAMLTNYNDIGSLVNSNKKRLSANQEIPDLFSPTEPSIHPSLNTHPVPSSSHGGSVPPPLLLMSTVPLSGVTHTVSSSLNGLVESGNGFVQTSHANALPGPSVQVQPQPQTLTALPNATKNQPTACIKGAWLNNKSISCLFVEEETRKGQYCLVEAVCKLYFNGCSVNEFLFALKNVLNVPLLTCNDAEEKAFIQYYSLPVSELKCNKMIGFEDLEKYFPQLTYMFPSKEAIDENESTLGAGSISSDQTILDTCDQSSTVLETPVFPNSDISQKRPLENLGIEGPPVKVHRNLAGKNHFLY